MHSGGRHFFSERGRDISKIHSGHFFSQIDIQWVSESIHGYSSMRYNIRKSWEPRRIRLYSFNYKRRKIKEAITKKIQKGKEEEVEFAETRNIRSMFFFSYLIGCLCRVFVWFINLNLYKQWQQDSISFLK